MLGIGRAGPLGRDQLPDGGGGPGRDRWSPGSDERDAWVVVAGVHGVGPVSFGRLVATFGSAVGVLRAASEPNAVGRLVAASTGGEGSPTLTGQAAAALVRGAADPQPFLAAVRRSGVSIVTLAEEAYPRRLRLVDLPPPVLFLTGDPGALGRARAVAVVGTRRPTAIGRATAGRIADAIARGGATVVSGLAFGIDATAHVAAVRAGVPTVAVLGGGHEHLYPASHRGLARDIVAGGGAVVSEFAPDSVPSRGTFPRRNRIISGLADATVVVEAGSRSGSLTTAAWALEQGRGLFIVPGRLDDPAVAGSLSFLREAGPEARVVAGIPELLVDLGLVGMTSEPGLAAGTPVDACGETLPPAEALVARALVAGIGNPDELALATGLPGAAVLGLLTSLEVRGLALEVFGRYRAAGALAPGAPARPHRVRTGSGSRAA